MELPRHRAALCLLVVATLASCDDSPAAPKAVSLAVTPSSVTLTSIGDTVAFSATISDQYQAAFPGMVAWASNQPSVFTVTTGGLVTAVANGSGVLTASFQGLSATANVAVAQVASAVEVVAGDGQTVRQGLALPETVIAKVTDAGGSPVEGVSVAFAPAAGDGTADPDTVATDANGRARSAWTLGDHPGAQSLTVSVVIAGGPSAGVAATALPPLPVVSFEAAEASGSEGDVVVLRIVVVYEGPAPDSAIVVRYAVAADADTETADADVQDHDRGTGGTLSLPPGTPSVDLEVAISDDQEIEAPRETFTVAVTPSPADLYEVGASAIVVVTIEEGVCDRTPRVRDEIIAQAKMSDCALPTASDLAQIRELNLTGLAPAAARRLEPPIFEPERRERMPAGNDQHRSPIRTLREADFAGLSELRFLHLGGNGLSSLPDGVFAGLSALQVLDLWGNTLSSLPDGVFDGLSELHELRLWSNGLLSLPDGVFAGLGELLVLDLWGNGLLSLPDGVFAGLSKLRFLSVGYNPGTPFPLAVDVVRTDAADPLAPGPATVVARVGAGTPFPMTVRLRAEGGVLSDSVVDLKPGGTESGSVTVAPDGSGSHRFVELAATPSLPESSIFGLEVVATAPLVLADPPEVTLDLPVVYLVQATQNRRGAVPLVAGRQALLRVFGTSDLPSSYQPRPVAKFYLGGEEAHVVRMTPLEFLPMEVEEGRLDRSYNATVPGSVVQPGLEIVVELDPEGIVSQASGSTSRFEADVQVSMLPPMEMTLVPVHFASDSNKTHNSEVTEFAQEVATRDETGFMWYVRNILPIGDLRVRVREPYVTQSDEADDGAIALLDEIAMLRFLEAKGTQEYYHGLWARPRVVSDYTTWQASGFGMLPGYSAISEVFLSDQDVLLGRGVFAHELGHNLSLLHAPCGNPDGADPDFPYSEGAVGTFGYGYERSSDLGPTRGPHGSISPRWFRDLMSYCDPKWTSDYSFTKAMEHRIDLAGTRGAGAFGLAPTGKVLLLWGGVRGDALRLEPAFAAEARSKLPDRPGPYSLTGTATNGEVLFQLGFSPDPIDHGGATFLFAVPFEDEWTDALDRIELSGPEGTTSVDRNTGGRAAIVVDESTNLVRSIIRDWAGVQGAVPEAFRNAARVVVRRGLPRW